MVVSLDTRLRMGIAQTKERLSSVFSLRRGRHETLILDEYDRPHDKCAVFGTYLFGSEPASTYTYRGLFAQQHRGQEASGIVSSNGKIFFSHKKEGFTYPRRLTEKLPGHIAIGHNRYSTDGGPGHIQPVVSKTRGKFIAGEKVALAHNGNLPDVTELKTFLQRKRIKIDGLNDSELMHRAIEYYVTKEKMSLPDAVKAAYPLFIGAFSLTIMDKETLIGVRDNHGIRPLSLGKLENGYVLSSETCGIDTIGGKHIRDVAAGEMVVITNKGVGSVQIAPGKQQLDIFEFNYFARGDSRLYGLNVHEVRKNFGRQAAKERRIDADVVIAVPNTSMSQAIGYAQESGIPFDMGLFKNPYIHRTFITPEKDRGAAVRMKFSPIPEVIKGKRIVIVDDSLVRGTTFHHVIKEIRACNPSEIHVVIAAPPIRYPHLLGVDIPDQKQLIAANKTIDAIREEIGADSLQYLSFDGMIQATGLTKDDFYTACFDGNYPVPIGRQNESKIRRDFPSNSLDNNLAIATMV